jgi:hypothetical protein
MLNEIWYSNVGVLASPIFNRMPGSGVTLENNSSVLILEGISMRSTVVMTQTGLFDFKIRMMPNANTVGNVLLIGGVYVEVMVQRGTGFPQ